MSSNGIFTGNGGYSAFVFKVLGGTEPPSLPGENTLWVNTEQQISGWIVAPNEPEAPEEGMLWLRVKNSGSLSLNLLKKNGLRIFPAGVKQYVDGAWSAREAEIYTQGQWIHITGDMYLIKNGLLTPEAGEMKTVALALAAPSVGQGDGTYNIATPGWVDGWATGCAYVEMGFDLSDYKAVSFTGTAACGVANTSINLIVSSGAPSSSSNNSVAYMGLSGSYADARLDISALEGEHYIGFSIYSAANIYITELRLVAKD